MTLALQNRDAARGGRRYRLTFAIASGFVVLMIAVMGTEYFRKIFMHASLFYQVACGVFPLLLVAAAHASKLRWPATTVAGVYSAVKILMGWILPLFPATPRLAPIYQDITHMVPMDFPLLVIVPAIALDLILRRWPPDGTKRDWALSAGLGVVFFAIFLAVQWPFAEFLMSPVSHNPIFFADNIPYFVPKTSYASRGVFPPLEASTASLARGLAIAALIAMVSSRFGLWLGAWMSRVRR
jgi:hypothetical protein